VYIYIAREGVSPMRDY